MSSFLDHDEDVGTPRRGGVLALLVLGVLVLLALAAYIGVWRYAGDKVPLGTRVEGVSIGGLAPARAQARLRHHFGSATGRTLTFVHRGDRYRLVPARSGVSIDYAATVRAAGGGSHSASPARLWDFLAGGSLQRPVVRFDRQRFDRALQRLTRTMGQPEVEGDIVFRDGRAHPVYSRSGLSVDRARMKQLVSRLLFNTTTETDLPVSYKRPYVHTAAVDRAMRRFARPAMSGPVTVVIGGQRVVATPEMFGPALSMVPNGHRLVPALDGDQLVRRLRPAMRTVGDKPSNAGVHIVDGHPKLVPAVVGASFDNDQLARAFLKHLTRSGDARTFTLHAAVTRPRVSTAQVAAYGIRQRVGSATVPAPEDARLVGRLHHHLVRPGHSLSVSDVLGQPDTDLATAVFDAALMAGYQIVDRRPVQQHHTGLPVGREAADVTVRDDGEHGLLLSTERQGNAVTVTLWSTRDRRARVRVGRRTGRVKPPVLVSTGPRCTPRRGTPGYTVAVSRTVSRHGSRSRDSFLTTYQPVEKVACATMSIGPSASPAG